MTRNQTDGLCGDDWEELAKRFEVIAADLQSGNVEAAGYELRNISTWIREEVDNDGQSGEDDTKSDSEVLREVAKCLIKISSEAPDARPPGDEFDHTSYPGEFIHGYRNGRFLAAESALDVISHENDALSLDEVLELRASVEEESDD